MGQALQVALGLTMALSLTACASLGAPSPIHSLRLEAEGQEAQGSLLLELGGLPYRLQSLADLARLRITLKRSGSQDLIREVDAAALQAGQGRVSFEALSVGPVSVEVEGLDAQGQLLGFARADAAITAGGSTRVNLRLAVGGPATQGGLGLDLVVADEPASNLARPLKLVKAIPLPINNNTGLYTSVTDLQFDRQDRTLWAAMTQLGTTPDKVFHFTPDLSASSPFAEGTLLAPRPQGGMFLLDNHLWSTPVPNRTASIKAILPDHQVRNLGSVALASEHPASAWGATREGLWAVVQAFGSRIEGPALPNPFDPFPLPQSWELSPERSRLPYPARDLPQSSGLHINYGSYDIATGEAPDELIVHDESRAWLVNGRGGGRLFLRSEWDGPNDPYLAYHQSGGLPEQSNASMLQAGDTLAASGVVPGLIGMVAPDHRGGHWVLSTLRNGSRDFLVLWRRNPNATLTRVWGPFLSMGEVDAIRAAGPTPHRFNHDLFSNGSVEGGYGVRSVGGSSELMLQSYETQGTTQPGRLAITNSSGIFILEEQAATAP